MTTVALIGAGGKMGCRITDNLMGTDYDMRYVEVSERGIANLNERSLAVTPLEEAVQAADIVLLAVPDVAIGKVSISVVPLMKSGGMLVLLDPAAAYLGQLPERSDVTYFVAHPCHPPIFNDETTAEARKDYFGGIKAKQAVVCALVQGPEADYAKGEQLVTAMYAPVMRSHRITLENMATLEPAMAETIGAGVTMFLKDVMQEAVNRGVPYEAARDFMLGHLNVELAISFGEAGNPFSDACYVAMDYGREHWLKEGWQKLFEPESLRDQIDVMLHPEKLNKSQ